MKIAESLEKIANALQHQAMQDRLWTIEDIAAFTGYAYNFAASLKDRPDFPRPVIIGKQPRWIAQEIKDWTKRQR